MPDPCSIVALLLRTWRYARCKYSQDRYLLLSVRGSFIGDFNRCDCIVVLGLNELHHQVVDGGKGAVDVGGIVEPLSRASDARAVPAVLASRQSMQVYNNLVSDTLLRYRPSSQTCLTT